MKLPRRQFLHLAASATALPIMSRNARAQAYPSRFVRMVVPFPPGGSADPVARTSPLGYLKFGANRSSPKTKPVPAATSRQFRSRSLRPMDTPSSAAGIFLQRIATSIPRRSTRSSI